MVVVFIIGEMVGSGILVLFVVIVGVGWIGFVLLVLCCFVFGYCGMVLGRFWVIFCDCYDEYKGYVWYLYLVIGEKVYGRWVFVVVIVCINIIFLGSVLKFFYKFVLICLMFE